MSIIALHAGRGTQNKGKQIYMYDVILIRFCKIYKDNLDKNLRVTEACNDISASANKYAYKLDILCARITHDIRPLKNSLPKS